MIERAVERIDDRRQPLGGACERGLGRHAFLGPHRRHHRDHVAHRIEHHDDRRPHQHRVRNADRVGIGRGQLLDQPHHVVAEIAEDAGCHWRQRVGQRNLAFGNERAQRLQRWLVAGRERAVAARRAIDLGAALDRAPDEVRLEPDDRIAPTRRAAFDRFQQKAHGTAAGNLEERRDRRLKIGNQGGPDHLRLAARITLGEGRRLRLDLHEA